MCSTLCKLTLAPNLPTSTSLYQKNRKRVQETLPTQRAQSMTAGLAWRAGTPDSPNVF